MSGGGTALTLVAALCDDASGASNFGEYGLMPGGNLPVSVTVCEATASSVIGEH